MAGQNAHNDNGNENDNNAWLSHAWRWRGARTAQKNKHKTEMTKLYPDERSSQRFEVTQKPQRSTLERRDVVQGQATRRTY